MKRLSLRAAQRCETARTPHCKCRCHGLLHGAAGKRANGSEAGDIESREYFEQLPAEDPHHITSAEEIKQRRKLLRADRKRAEAVTRGQDRLFDETA